MRERAPLGRTAFAIAAAIALIVLAVPRVVAALYAVPATDVIGKLDRFGATRPDVIDLVAAQQALQMAQRWQHDPALATELARIDLILATRQAQNGQDAKPLLDETIETTHAALHGNPAQARAWLILSEATLLRDGVAAPKLADYLSRSLSASPYDLGLALNRVWLATMLWDRLDAPTRRIAAVQMQWVARRWRIEMLVGMARQLGNPNPAREALLDDPVLRQRFEAMYLSY